MVNVPSDFTAPLTGAALGLPGMAETVVPAGGGPPCVAWTFPLIEPPPERAKFCVVGADVETVRCTGVEVTTPGPLATSVTGPGTTPLNV